MRRLDTVRVGMPIVRVDGRTFAMDVSCEDLVSREVDAFEVTHLVADDATSALVDVTDDGERAWLGGQCIGDVIAKAPGGGQELRRVTLAVEVRYSVVSDDGGAG